MLLTEQKDFIKILAAVGEMYHREVTPSFIKLYWEVLQPYAWEDVSFAFEAHVKDPTTGQFMPKPADIIRVIKGGGECQSLQAWSKVEKAIRLVGPYRSVVFDDPIIHAVLQEMGGWIKICHSSEKQLLFVAKEFQTRCASFRYKAPTLFPNHFAGIIEHKNAHQGIYNEHLMFIGNKEKAQAVLNYKDDGVHLNQRKSVKEISCQK